MFSRIINYFRICKLKIKLGNKIKIKGDSRLSAETKLSAKFGNICVQRIITTGKCEISAYSGMIEIGTNVSFNRNCLVVCRDGIKIGDNCRFGPNVCIYDHNHKFNENGICEGFKSSKIGIGNNCWIGAGVIILKNAKIGDGCIIGAGSVIDEEIPAHSLVKSSRELEIIPIVKKRK